MREEVHLEDLLGRRVRASNGRIIGRLEEVRAEWRGNALDVTEFLIGPGALVERLAIVHWIFGRKPRTLVARWDQIAIGATGDATLTCKVDELHSE